MPITGKCSLLPTNLTFLFLKQGTVGFENQINKCLELAEYLYAKIKNREEFEMVFNGEVSCHHRLDIQYFQKIYWGRLLGPYFPALPNTASEVLFLCTRHSIPFVSMDFPSSITGMTFPFTSLQTRGLSLAGPNLLSFWGVSYHCVEPPH